MVVKWQNPPNNKNIPQLWGDEATGDGTKLLASPNPNFGGTCTPGTCPLAPMYGRLWKMVTYLKSQSKYFQLESKKKKMT